MPTVFVYSEKHVVQRIDTEGFGLQRLGCIHGETPRP